MNQIIQNWDKISQIIGTIVTIATVIVGLGKIIAKLTPTPQDDKVFKKIAFVLSKIIQLLKKVSLIK